MAVTVASVKACSITGEFNTLSDTVIGEVIGEVELQYKTLVKEFKVAQAPADRLASLHVAHILYIAKKQETNGEDLPGPVKSESLARIGSRSYGSAAKLEGDGPFPDWADSPYGRRAQRIWANLPPAMFFSFPSATGSG